MFDSLKSQGVDALLFSSLLSQDNFYATFDKDLLRAKREVIIESPFISLRRLNYLTPTLRKLRQHKVRVIVNTKPAEEQEGSYYGQAEDCISALQNLGVEVLITGGHHRKLAIIDRQVLYEGSLNILSQNDSCEVMRRIYSEQLALQMINFTGIGKFIG